MMKNKRIENEFGHSEGEGLYRADFEHSSCGIGFVANLKGRKSHSIITDALGMLACMEHVVEPDLTCIVGMAQEFFCKFLMSSSKRSALRQALRCPSLGSKAWG